MNAEPDSRSLRVAPGVYLPLEVYVDAYMGGFLLTEQQIGQLCITAYGQSQAYVDHMGPLDTAFEYFCNRAALDSPNFVAVDYRHHKIPTLREAYVLPCRIALVNHGTPPPDLPFDEKAEAYANYWFPPHVRHSEPFKNVPYVECKYPRDVLFEDCFRRKLTEHSKEGLREYYSWVQGWMRRQKAKGTNYFKNLPPRLTSTYRLSHPFITTRLLKNLPPEIAKDATSLMVLLYKYE